MKKRKIVYLSLSVCIVFIVIIGYAVNAYLKGKKQDSTTILLDKYEGIYRGNSKNKNIYLTFDCGYENGNTIEILNVLKRNNVKAAFFVTREFIQENREAVKRIISDGHILGNHTKNHYNMTICNEKVITREIMDLHNEIYKKFGYEMKYLRPPELAYNDESLKITKSLGYITVTCSYFSDDWDQTKQGKEKKRLKEILSSLHNGEVLLLHAVSADSTNILNELIIKVKEAGFEFKTLDEFYTN